MTKTLNISAEERIERYRERNRIAQAKYREKHGDEINARRRMILKENTRSHEESNKKSDEFVNDKVKEPILIASTTTKGYFTIDEAIRLIPQHTIKITAKNYISDLRRLRSITGCNDLLECLSESQNVVKMIENNTTYSINTKKQTLQVVLYVITKFNLPIHANDIEFYKNRFENYKILSKEKNANKQTDEKKEHKIYLFETTDVNKNGEKIYKVGRSGQLGVKRLNNYPKGYKFVFARCCIDSVPIERKIIELFNTKYTLAFGREYFSGDCFEMVKDINDMLDAEHKEEQKTAVNCEEKTIKIEESKPIIECQEKEASTLVDDLKKIFIKIKSFMKNDKKRYYITNEKDEILHYIWNSYHMERILSNDCYEFADEPQTFIEENVLIDINNLNILETTPFYALWAFNIVNFTEENITKILHHTNGEKDYFTNLNVYGKIIYLFECDTLIDNIEGRFMVQYRNNEKYLCSFFKNNRSSVVETNTIRNVDDDVKYHEFTNHDDDNRNDDELNEIILFCFLGLIRKCQEEETYDLYENHDLYLCNDDIDELFANQRKHSLKFQSLLWI